MNEKLRKDLEVMLSVLHNFVPHVHYQHLVVVVNQPLRDLVQLRKKLKAFVVDEIRKDEVITWWLLLGSNSLPIGGLFGIAFVVEGMLAGSSSQVKVAREKVSDYVQ